MESYPENGLSLTGLRFESLVTYYGIYSSSHRGKCKRENREERVEEIMVEAVPVSSAARQPSNWAKWIRNIYETDPLTCCKCGEPMQIIAFITDQLEVAKILKHIGEQTSRAPPLVPTDPVSSSCVFDDTNFQHAEVFWYPNPPALDF